MSSMVLASASERKTIIPMLLRRGLYLEALELSLETTMLRECPEGLEQVVRGLAAQCATCQASLVDGGDTAAAKLQAASMWKLLEHAVVCASSTSQAFACQEAVSRVLTTGVRVAVHAAMYSTPCLFPSPVHCCLSYTLTPCRVVFGRSTVLTCVCVCMRTTQAVDSMLTVHAELAIPQWLLDSIVKGSRRNVGSRGSAGNEQGLLRVLINHYRLAEACHIASTSRAQLLPCLQ